MTMNVRIRLTGDVLVYEKNEFWNLVFITDANHVVDLTANGQSVKLGGLRIPGVTRHMMLMPYDAPNLIRKRGADFGNILNFSAPYLHGTAVGGGSNLSAAQTSAPGRELMHLFVPLGEVNGEDFVCDYWISNAAQPANRWEVGHKIAKTVTITFDVDQGVGIGLAATDPLQLEYFHWPYSARGLELDFDNDCHTGHAGQDDFLNYYDWVHDKRDDRKFIAGKIECEEGPGGAQIRNQQGNCDPAVIEPAPSD